MNRTRLALVLLALATTAATAPAQYPGYPQYNPENMAPGAFPAYGVPIGPYVPPNTMVTTGAFVATPPPAANAFSGRPPTEAFVEPPYVPCVWASASYLSWTIQRAPNPVPLVTNGSTANAVPGAIGQPATTVLYGTASIDFGTQSGAQVSFGGWLNYDRCVGVEASVFYLEPKDEQFLIGSNATGSPALFLPFGNRTTGAQNALAISKAGQQGLITVDSKFNFEGVEANALFNLCRTECFETNLLLGGRYLSLREGMAITAATNGGAGLTTTRFDEFDTHNDFFGGQIGARMGYRQEWFNVEATAKIAVGPTYSAVDVGGITNVTRNANGSLVSSSLGGVFAKTGNIRHETRQDTSLVPQFQIKAGVNIGSNVTLFAAYDFLYLNEIVRPGDQIDHNLVPSPLPIFNRTDFWAQGVSVGLEVKF